MDRGDQAGSDLERSAFVGASVSGSIAPEFGYTRVALQRGL